MSTTRTDETWRQQAQCLGLNPALFFPERGESPAAAKQVCHTCPVARECLQYAIDNNEEAGVWGGQDGHTRSGRTPRRPQGGQPQPIQHGTPGGYMKHRRTGTVPCAECRTAHNTANYDARRRKRAA